VKVPVPLTSGVPDSDRCSVPLAVAGTVHGRLVEALVGTLSEVLAQIARWIEVDPAAIGCWGLRTDYSDPLTLSLRGTAGTVRESMRVVHLLRLRPGEPHGSTVTVLCGERLRIVGVEVLPVGTGMPCSACLAGGLSADFADREPPARIVTWPGDRPELNS
jgi:hypothetical protein